MKTNSITTEMQKNIGVYQAVAEVAQQVFKNVVCKPGKYTVADICKNWVSDKYGNFMKLADDVYKPGQTLSAGYEDFECSFLPSVTFEILRGLELQIPVKHRVSFCREVSSDKVIASFVIPKDAKLTVKHVANDVLRPVMNYVCCDLENRCLVTSDGHTLCVMGITGLSSGSKAATYLLPAAFVKKHAGAEVRIVADTYAVSEGDTCELLEGRYPNWKSVLPSHGENQRITFGKNALAELLKAVKKAKSFVGDYAGNCILLSGKQGESMIEISVDNRDFQKSSTSTIVLPEALAFSFKVALHPERLLRVHSADCLYIGSYARQMVSFISKGSVTIMMPNGDYEQRFTDDPQNPVGALSLAGLDKSSVELTPQIAEDPADAQEDPVDVSSEETCGEGQQNDDQEESEEPLPEIPCEEEPVVSTEEHPEISGEPSAEGTVQAAEEVPYSETEVLAIPSNVAQEVARLQSARDLVLSGKIHVSHSQASQMLDELNAKIASVIDNGLRFPSWIQVGLSVNVPQGKATVIRMNVGGGEVHVKYGDGGTEILQFSQVSAIDADCSIAPVLTLRKSIRKHHNIAACA